MHCTSLDSLRVKVSAALKATAGPLEGFICINHLYIWQFSYSLGKIKTHTFTFRAFSRSFSKATYNKYICHEKVKQYIAVDLKTKMLEI